MELAKLLAVMTRNANETTLGSIFSFHPPEYAINDGTVQPRRLLELVARLRVAHRTGTRRLLRTLERSRDPEVRKSIRTLLEDREALAYRIEVAIEELGRPLSAELRGDGDEPPLAPAIAATPDTELADLEAIYLHQLHVDTLCEIAEVSRTWIDDPRLAGVVGALAADLREAEDGVTQWARQACLRRAVERLMEPGERSQAA
jgi:hypothetical protein